MPRRPRKTAPWTSAPVSRLGVFAPRALLIAALGIVACSAVLAANLVITIHGFVASQPLHGLEWWWMLIFAVLPLVVLAVGLRAFHREWRSATAERGAGEPSRHDAVRVAGGVLEDILHGVGLANAPVDDQRHSRHVRAALGVPVLVGIGLVLGLVAGVPLSRERIQSMNKADHAACEELYGAGVSAATLQACLPVAQGCRARLADRPLDGPVERLPMINTWPRGLAMPHGPHGQRRLLCIFKQLPRGN